jgi:L-ascorbate metabolism protein UlaG (beta-lactamase superfamily)
MRRLAVLLLLAAGGCAGSIAHLDVRGGVVERACCPDMGDVPVELEYLGTGGWIIRRGDDAVMTAPFFSNPRLLRALFLPIRPAQELIREQMRTVKGREHVRIVLAGHAHYDHLFDVETALDELPAEARVYGGRTVTALVPRRSVDVTAQAGTRRMRGEWIRQGNVRFLPIFSEHAAHVLGIKAMNGHYDKPRERPSFARHWKEGEPLAYVIDLLDKDKVALRIYYDDSAHDAPYGYVDDETLREHRIDIAILCVASHGQTAAYPTRLVNDLKPRHVLLGHWEDFFLPYRRPERTVRGTDVPEFIDKLPPGTQWTMLKRRGVVRFVP